MAKNSSKNIVNCEKNKKSDKKRLDNFINHAWTVMELCLDTIENRLVLMANDISSADISKLTQMFGSVFDRIMEISCNFREDQSVKKIEDFD